ncbi:hypothetical protein T439DRAFT_151605 [Meredithblackwellia eburnea MCA 4105]
MDLAYYYPGDSKLRLSHQIKPAPSRPKEPFLVALGPIPTSSSEQLLEFRLRDPFLVLLLTRIDKLFNHGKLIWPPDLTSNNLSLEKRLQLISDWRQAWTKIDGALLTEETLGKAALLEYACDIHFAACEVCAKVKEKNGRPGTFSYAYPCDYGERLQPTLKASEEERESIERLIVEANLYTHTALSLKNLFTECYSAWDKFTTLARLDYVAQEEGESKKKWSPFYSAGKLPKDLSKIASEPASQQFTYPNSKKKPSDILPSRWMVDRIKDAVAANNGQWPANVKIAVKCESDGALPSYTST